MLGSPILDVAIGMAFVYLLLSLIASTIQEALAALTQARSANLQRGLNSLFSGDGLGGDTKLVQLLLEHGLIRGLYQDPEKDFAHATKDKQNEVRARLRRFSRFRLWVRQVMRINPPGVEDQPEYLLLPAYIPARTFALAIRQILGDPNAVGDAAANSVTTNLARLRAASPNNKALEALWTLVQDAGGKPERLQRNLENWYNDGMDRVSGWYKKYAQNVLLVIGLILAVVFNVNSLRLGRELWVDKDARAGLVATATDYLDQQKSAAVPADAEKPDLAHRMSDTVSAFDKVAGDQMLPMGWRHSPASYGQAFRQHPGYVLWQLLIALLGWAVTGLALSLGASFWFDTLNKFMVVRNTIKPQEKSQTEASKDKQPEPGPA